GGSTALSQDAPGAVTWALDFLVRTSGEDAARDRVVDLLLRGSELPFSDAKRRAVRLSAADLADPERGLAIYRELFAADPKDDLVAGRLERALRAGNRSVELAELRMKQVAVASSSERRVELRFEAASLLAEVGEPD